MAPFYCVETAESVTELLALTEDWEKLEARDPEASVFVSHDWLAPVLINHEGRWRVYLVRRGVEPVALLPVVLRTVWCREAKRLRTRIDSAGVLAGVPTGLLVDPRHAEGALEALGHALRARPWAELRLSGLSAERADALGADLLGAGTATSAAPEAALAVPLPETYEDFVKTRFSSSTRFEIRGYTRRELRSCGWQLVFSTEDTLERDIDRLLSKHLKAWAVRDGATAAHERGEEMRHLLRRAFSEDALALIVLKRGDEVIASAAHLVDRAGGEMRAVLLDTAPGDTATLFLTAMSIAWGIEQGLAHYRFNNEDSSWCERFGAEPVGLHGLEVTRRLQTEEAGFDRPGLARTPLPATRNGGSPLYA
ncbi:GNAT family N-acetyltransferase [Litorisediminicola beolgyonensis]|uniref:GNAT family N-acetyltransferase n=1 Tax=Litorisediminicola beolgyonensis TaxID=1173614 RepID=A0ABW3ZLV8_9RHOB